jgi:hypothetical protein
MIYWTKWLCRGGVYSLMILLTVNGIVHGNSSDFDHPTNTTSHGEQRTRWMMKDVLQLWYRSCEQIQRSFMQITATWATSSSEVIP